MRKKVIFSLIVSLLMLTGLLTGVSYASADTVTNTIPVGDSPLGVAENFTTNMIYVANMGSSTVTVINGATNTVTATIPMGSDSPAFIAVDSFTNTIYTSNAETYDVTVINGATNTVTATIPLGAFGRIAVDWVSNHIYVTGLNSTTLYCINGSNNTVYKQVTLPSTVWALAADAGTDTVYVTGSTSDCVYKVDGLNGTILDTLNLGGSLNNIAVNFGTGTVYASRASSNGADLCIMDETNLTLKTTIPNFMPDAGVFLATDPRTNTIYAASNGTPYYCTLNGATNVISNNLLSSDKKIYGLDMNPNTGIAYILRSVSGGSPSDVEVVSHSTQTAPSSTTNLSCTNLGSTSATITWQYVSAATSYNVYKDNVLVGSTTNQTYTDTSLSPSTQYSYTVTSLTGTAESAPCVTLTIQTLTEAVEPATPINISCTGTTTNSASIAWPQVSGATSYNVYINNTQSGSTSGTAYTASGLSSNTQYSFTVTAVASSYESPKSSALLVTTQVAVVTPTPTGLTCTNFTANSASMTWQSVSGATSYNIYVNNSFYGSTSSTSYTDSSLNPSTQYSFTVTAIKSSVESSQSSPLVVTTQAIQAPTSLSCTSLTTNSASITWQSVSGATSYKVYVNSSLVGSTSNLTYTDSSLIPSTQYSFTVTAVESSFASAQSSPLVVTTPALTAPTNLTCTDLEISTASIAWTSVSGATSYNVYVNGSLSGSTSNLNYTDSTLNPNTQYSFAVAAVASTCTSPQSSPLVVTTQTLTAPTNLTCTDLEINKVSITWQTVPGATVYKVYINGILSGSTSSLTYTNSLLSPNTQYSFTVDAIESSFESPQSLPLIVTTQAILQRIYASSIGKLNVILVSPDWANYYDPVTESNPTLTVSVVRSQADLSAAGKTKCLIVQH